MKDMTIKTVTRYENRLGGVVMSVNGVTTAAFTGAEMRAMSLIGTPTSTDSTFTFNDAGNEIIALAEQIKAERAVMAMV